MVMRFFNTSFILIFCFEIIIVVPSGFLSKFRFAYTYEARNTFQQFDQRQVILIINLQTLQLL